MRTMFRAYTSWPAAAFLLGCFVTSPASAADVAKLVAAKVTQPPSLDGKADDATWRSSKPVEVAAKGVMPKTRGTSATVTLRAAHSDTHVYLLVQWMTVLAGTASAQSVKFDDAKPGALPSGWTGTKTGKGEPKWTVEKDDSAPSKPNVLKQSGEADYPVALKDDTTLKDGFVEVKFKPVSGKEDQAGGVIWRAKDADNYYICRANALEENVVLYKTENGKRKSLDIVGRKGGYGVKEKVASGQWHTLRVEFAGNSFKVTFNGKHLFDVEDATFKDGGKVGLWTKADSVTLFDDFGYGAK